MIELLASPEAWIALLTLTALELVLGIDNVIFISILVDKLPPERRESTRRIGLFLAMFMRIGLLLVLSWLVGLTAPLWAIPFFNHELSGRDLILIAGGMFLLYKSTVEIHQLVEGEEGHASSSVKGTFTAVLAQIIVIDLVFSLDSIITAVGMVNEIPIMVTAVVLSVGMMMVFAGPLGRFVSAHPTVKMLALAFLFTIGVALIAEGFERQVPKGYLYFAMAFSVAVEMLNLRRARKTKTKPVDLRERYARVKPPDDVPR
jgi:predicted tellurium resistance membrane protein TerC